MKLGVLLIALFALLWYGGAFSGWYRLEYKRGGRPRDAGEWIALILGWMAIVAVILFLFSAAFR
jgi:hypothetical protein